MCENSPLSHLCYHPTYGSWIGLRAVVVFDLDFSYASEFVVPKAENCYSLGTQWIWGECANSLEEDQQAKVILDDLMLNTDYHCEYTNDDVWRRWLSLRTISSDSTYIYSWNQVAYHYSKNQKYLQGDIDRLKRGEYKPDYSWLELFKKDVLNFRRGVF